MSADWERVQEIFLAASELEGVARDTWLEEACGADAALRDDVESLLAASADGESLISAAVQGAFELAAEESGSSKARQRIGPYEIGNKLGEGGLSTVFLAQRADDEFNMRVAIKVVKRGMDTADILRRLRQERQILAHLDHPNVAKIFDGGTTDDGLPYFVMEHIEGEPIDEYCDRRELSISERLELFRTACSAVHAAHQSLVIHRDIKPSNLLVTADGIPKLLDFGIAKLIDAEPQLHTLAQTAPGMVLMTPEFASPEQVTGQPLTTATDVYSLGVMLYRLLTGHRPYRFASGRPAEVERILLRSKPERPSVVVGRTIEELTPTGGTVTLTPETVARPREGTPEKLRRRLAGDLDKIVLMAIRKEPQRRYASVEQLAEDIERSLQSLPVLAQKDTIRYRTGKFVRRNRGSVAAGALILLALLGGIVTTSWQARVAVAERSRAEQHLAEARLQSARAERVSDFLTGLFEISDPGEARGNQVTAREILDRGAERIRQELSEEPDLRAELMITMGRVYRNLGLYGPAGELLAEVQAERRRTLGEAHPEVARNLTRVAEIEFEKGQWDTAEDLLRRALESQRQQLGDEHVDVATTLHQLAMVLAAAERTEDAEAHLGEALALRRQLLGDDHRQVAETRNQLAELYYRQSRWQSAEALFRQVLEQRSAQLGETHPEVAESLNNLAVVLRAQGKTEPAIPLFRRVLELRQRLFGAEHPDIAVSLNNLGTSLQAMEQWQESARPLRQALAMNEKLLGAEHPLVAVNRTNLARSLAAVGQIEDAEALFLQALDLSRRLFGDEHPDVTLILFRLATLYAENGRQQEALPLFDETVAIQRRILPQGDFRLSYPLLELARLHCGRGDRSAAEPPLREALAIRRQSFAEEHPHRIMAEELQQSCAPDLER